MDSKGTVSPEVLQQLERVLSSPGFQGSARLGKLLTYLVERSESGGAAPKEYCIGVDVLDRGEQFDPKSDSVVRTTARHLRLKLAEYYEAAGREDPIQLLSRRALTR